MFTEIKEIIEICNKCKWILENANATVKDIEIVSEEIDRLRGYNEND